MDWRRKRALNGDPAPQTRVLEHLLHQGRVSNSGLLKIIKTLRDASAEGFFELPTENEFHAAFYRRFVKLARSVTLELENGPDFVLEYVEPSLLFAELVAENEHLATLIENSIDENGDIEFSLIVAYDEFAPGNKLQYDNRRKVMVSSFSFREFQQAALAEDTNWITPLILRSCILSKVKGGWSHVLKLLLNKLLFGPQGLATAGVPLQLPRRGIYLFKAKLTNILSDGDGLRMGYDWRGHASLKPCFIHHNVWMKNSDIAGRSRNGVEITCSDASKFLRWGKADVASTVDLLSAGKARWDSGQWTKAKFDNLQKVVGINFNEKGLLWDRALRDHYDLPGCFRYDWVHCLLQDGTFTCEAWLYLNVNAVLPETMCAYLKDPSWAFPFSGHRKSKLLHRVFDSYRTSPGDDAGKLKCSASELLSLYGLIRHYAETQLPEEESAARKSFMASCEVLDLLMLCKRGIAAPAETAAQLRVATAKHLRLHLEAHGSSGVRPKHHWVLDIPDQILQDGLLLDSFVIERKHLHVKAIAEHVKNTHVFERSVLAGVTNVHMQRARECTDAALRGRRKQWGAAVLAPHMAFLGLQVG